MSDLESRPVSPPAIMSRALAVARNHLVHSVLTDCGVVEPRRINGDKQQSPVTAKEEEAEALVQGIVDLPRPDRAEAVAGLPATPEVVDALLRVSDLEPTNRYEWSGYAIILEMERRLQGGEIVVAHREDYLEELVDRCVIGLDLFRPVEETDRNMSILAGELALGGPSKLELARALRVLGKYGVTRCLWPEARALLGSAVEVASRAGSGRMVLRCHLDLAELALVEGSLDVVTPVIRVFRTMGRSVPRHQVREAGLLASEAFLREGQVVPARRLLGWLQQWDANDRDRGHADRGWRWILEARVSVVEGEMQQATTLLDRARDELQPMSEGPRKRYFFARVDLERLRVGLAEDRGQEVLAELRDGLTDRDSTTATLVEMLEPTAKSLDEVMQCLLQLGPHGFVSEEGE